VAEASTRTRGHRVSLLGAVRAVFARPYPKIAPAQARELVGTRRAVLLDVREPHEWRAGHAERARHIPLDQLPQRLGELPAGRPVITVCRSGMRSARAASLLARHGHEVYNLSGGMAAWARAGLPLRASGGGAGRIR
jgi:rhodanese-related sulfurtransferase